MKGIKRFCAGALDILGWILAIPGLLIIFLSTFLLIGSIMLLVFLFTVAVILACILLIPTGILELASKSLES